MMDELLMSGGSFWYRAVFDGGSKLWWLLWLPQWAVPQCPQCPRRWPAFCTMPKLLLSADFVKHFQLELTTQRYNWLWQFWSDWDQYLPSESDEGRFWKMLLHIIPNHLASQNQKLSRLGVRLVGSLYNIVFPSHSWKWWTPLLPSPTNISNKWWGRVKTSQPTQTRLPCCLFCGHQVCLPACTAPPSCGHRTIIV